MIQRDDLPPTPDWDISYVIRVTPEEFAWLIADDDEHLIRGEN